MNYEERMNQIDKEYTESLEKSLAWLNKIEEKHKKRVESIWE